MEWSARQAVETSASTQQVPFNIYFEQMDVNTADYGLQGFVYKNIFDSGVATSKGSPVGATQAAGGSIVTPDQSDAGGAGVLGRGGGIAQVAVAANTNAYQWVQCVGIGRVLMKCTGALAANALGVWTGDDTVAAFTDPGNEELIFVRALVAASGGEVAAGNYLLL